MPPNAPRQLADLSDFLAALRVNGVPVGPAEIDRLRQLFALEPCLQRDTLKNLLSTLFIKTPEQRRVFDGLFADWCPDHEAEWSEEENAHLYHPHATRRPASPLFQNRPVSPTPPPVQHRLGRQLVMAFACVCLLAVLAWYVWPVPIVVQEPVDAQGTAMPLPGGEETGLNDLPSTPVDTVWFWKAEVVADHIRVPWQLGPIPLTCLGLAALAIAIGSCWQYRQRFPRITPVQRQYVGDNWHPLPPLARDDGALITAPERRQLLWHVEHFVSDDLTRRLHLAHTVEATARSGGFVHLYYTPAVYERAVWFWLDRQVQQTTPRTAVQQLLTTLTMAGLEARQGLFTDVPDRVDWPAQTGYQPAHEEGYGRQAMVVILTDGAGLARRLANPLSHLATDRLLRSLQRWPRLCFVDCAITAPQLASLLAPYGLQTLSLAELPGWLGGVETTGVQEPSLGTHLYGDARVWAAAVALSGMAVDTATAHSLRVALRLTVSPWQIEQIVHEAASPGTRYWLVNWFLRCEALDDKGRIPPDSLAGRALQWWQQRYREAEQRMLAQENPLLPWQDSLASQRWQLERALLQLYVDPTEAARQLAWLADAALHTEIKQRLSAFAAAEHRGQGSDNSSIYLPWRFADLSADTRQRLRQLGFAAGLFKRDPAPLKDSPRLLLATAVLGMVALSAFGTATYRWLTPNWPRLVPQEAVYNHPVLAAQTIRQTREPSGVGYYRVTLGSPRHIVSLPSVPAGAEVPVHWRWYSEANAIRLGDSQSVVLRAGRLAQPIRACSPDWPQRSLLVIAAPFEAEAARQLAIRLLDKGSADQILLGMDWQQQLDAWLGPSQVLNEATQVLVILPEAGNVDDAAARLRQHPGPWAVAVSDDFAGLAREIDFSGSRKVAQVSARLRVLRSQGEVYVYGGPERQPPDAGGIEWVHICPGTFTMGSLTGEDPMAEKDEIVDPQRTVVLSAFRIAATETTQRQHGKAGDEPVVDINWQDARTFCQDRGGDLPTEAQWEYAARGGSRFPWSFGDDADLLQYYAWFEKNSEGKAHAVRQQRPNPLGLYDMHGNVWEWVRDWYNDYTSEVFVDPLGPDAGKECLLSANIRGECRVVRGGSFFLSPADLRSASRVGVHPVGRGGRFGFRCVRVPPQP